MDIGIISVRYAKALLLFASQQGEEDNVYEEMTTLAQNCERETKIRLAMDNPIVKPEQKVSLLQAACTRPNAKLTQSTVRFIALIVKQGRANMVGFMANAYLTLYGQKKHLVKARLELPQRIDDHLVAKMRQAIEQRNGGKVTFEVSIRPEIEGGFILHYDTYCLDASLRTQVGKIRRELIQ